MPDLCDGRPCAGTGCSHEQAFAELVAFDQAHGHYDLNTPAAGPICPPGVHSMFDPCPGGCANDEESCEQCGDECSEMSDGLCCDCARDIRGADHE